MFKIPAATRAFWERLELKPASASEIAEIAGLAPGPLPDDYVTFLKTYGFARWMLTVPDRFAYRRADGGQQVIKVGSVAHLETPDSIDRSMKNAWNNEPELGLPCWPQGVMPVAGNAGPGQVLMNFDTKPVNIQYWEPAQDPWGKGSNTELCAVADTFRDFINGLVMRDEI